MLQKKFEVPVFGVILPGVRAALEKTRTQRIGIIGTSATIRSKAYSNGILARCDDSQGRAFGGGQNDHLHDALAVRLLRLVAAFIHGNLAIELIGQVNKLHRGPGVQPQLVAYDKFTGNKGHGIEG